MSTTTGNPSTYIYGVGTEITNSVSVKGYTFKGWYTEAGKKVTKFSKKSKGNKTLYAKLEPNTYKIIYKVDGVTNKDTGNPATYTYGEGATFTNGVEKEGYEFVGWYNKAKGGSLVRSITAKDTGKKILYARFKEVEEEKKEKAKFGLLFLRVSEYGTDHFTLEWNTLDAAEYDVDGYNIYGGPCGVDKIGQYNFITFVPANQGGRFELRSLDGKTPLEPGKYYKFHIVAVKKKGKKTVEVGESAYIHVTTDGGEFGVADTIKVKTTSKELKVGKSFTLKATESNSTGKEIKSHRPISFESSDDSIATVGTYDGVVTAVSEGTCQIWVYAQNGIYTSCVVTVTPKSKKKSKSKSK